MVILWVSDFEKVPSLTAVVKWLDLEMGESIHFGFTQFLNPSPPPIFNSCFNSKLVFTLQGVCIFPQCLYVFTQHCTFFQFISPPKYYIFCRSLSLICTLQDFFSLHVFCHMLFLTEELNHKICWGIMHNVWCFLEALYFMGGYKICDATTWGHTSCIPKWS